MPIDPSELLKLAADLLHGDEECRQRAAVGRAYYSAFHSMLPVATMLSPSRPDVKAGDRISHAELERRLKQWRPIGEFRKLDRLKTSAQVASRMFGAARQIREVSDYQLDMTLGAGEARLQIERCKRVVNFAAKVANEVSRREAG